jgi:mono/diheme cytochrome c family protein
MPRLPLSLALLLALGCEPAQKQARFTAAVVLAGVEVPAAELEQGAHLYVRYCASCHGDEGDGRGPAAAGLPTAPSDFREARFRHAVESSDQLPKHQDLIEVISRGVPEAGMPGWRGMRPEDLSALANYIKTFSPRWKEDRVPGTAQVIDRPPTPP